MRLRYEIASSAFGLLAMTARFRHGDSEMQLAHELGRRSAELRFEDLPTDAVQWAKVGILDTVGVTVAGSTEPCARIVGEVVAGSGASLVFGTAARASALDAALINGT